MRSISILALVGAMSTVCAQEKSLHLAPGWKYLDKRMVENRSTVKVTIGDSVAQATTGTSVVHLDIPDMRKEHFVLVVQTDAVTPSVGDMSVLVQELPERFRDSVLKDMQTVVRELYAPAIKGEMRLKIDKQGKAIEVLGEGQSKEEMKPVISDAVSRLQAISRENKRRTAQQLEASRTRMTDSLYEAISALKMGSITSLLEPYAITFPTTGSERQPTVLKDVSIPGIGTYAELPAMMEVGFDELNDKSFIARVVTTAHVDGIHKDILAAEPKSPIKKQDISIVKESLYHIDRFTTWPTLINTEWRARIGTTKSKVVIVSEFTIPKP